MLAFGACALFGSVRQARGAKAVADLASFRGDLVETENLMRQSRTPLPEIAAKLAESGRCPAFWEAVSRGLAGGLSFREAYSAAPKPELPAGAAEVADGLAAALGTGDLQTESERLTAAAERLAPMLSDLEKSTAEKGKLIRSLSLLAGLAAALLIL